MTTPGSLTAGQVAELRAELERQLSKLAKSMKITAEAMKTVELDQSAVGRLSRIDALQNQSLAKGLRDREIVQLSQIREALKYLDEGMYGTCKACGGSILFERLLVFPEAPECGACLS